MPASAKKQVTTVLEHELIEAVKGHPEIYRKPALKYGLIWCNIARKINSDGHICRSKWLEITYNYAYIKGIIRDRWELESVLQVHPKTSKYLDGSLNFLDPFIYNIKRIPNHIVNGYKWMDSYLKVNSKRDIKRDNNLTLVTQEMVQAALGNRTKKDHLDIPNMKYLMEALGTTITQCLMPFKNDETNIQATNIERNNLIYTQPIDQEEISCEDSDMADPLDEVTVDDCIAAGDEDILTNEVLTIIPDNVEIIEEEPDSENVTEDINKIILGTDIKTFFSDLVDFVSENFTLEKQKTLQRRVTQLVCELYADNDSK